MPICASAIKQSDGSFLLGLDPSVTDPTTCPYVVETGSESGFASLFSITPAEAGLLAVAVSSLWALAWGIRQLGKFISHEERSQNE